MSIIKRKISLSVLAIILAFSLCFGASAPTALGAAAEEAAKPDPQLELLTEIRDILKDKEQ